MAEPLQPSSGLHLTCLRSTYERALGRIQLNRTFSKIVLDADVSDDADLNARHSRAGNLLWPDLLTHHRVILLSEAGSGKTEEISNVARQLRSDGKPAFFLRIEHVKDFFEGAFEVGTHDEFISWCTSGTEGWILLDSVDEAKLRSPLDFELAIRKIGLFARKAGDNAHIVITSRLSAWRPKTDLALCRREFPFATSSDEPAESTDAASPFMLVTLDDIQGEQIDTFLRAKGVEDVDSFKAAIERTEASSLTTRPLDFLELVLFWKSQGKIGSRYELMRSSIERRLQEHDPNRSHAKPIAPNKLRRGARLVALATTLAQTSAIRIPDGNRNTRGMPLDGVLGDWTETECEALLSRPIFDEGIYGTTRFHHRSVREYLTAEWLHHQLLNEASRVKIEGLFFKTQYGREVIEPTMRPVLPWLALLDERTRDRAIRIAPEIFFEDGDPRHLPSDRRRVILQRVCKALARPAHDWTVTEHSAVQLFAHTDLAAVIKELLAEYCEHSHIVAFLLEMVAQAKMDALVPDAREYALNIRNARVKVAAIRAVRVAGSADDIASLRIEMLARTTKFGRDWLTELIEDMPMDEVWIQWLLDSLARSVRKPSYSSGDELAFAISDIVDACPTQHLHLLLEGFDELFDKAPAIDRGYCEISKRFSWLAEPAAQAALRLLKTKDAKAMEPRVLSVLRKLSRLDSYNDLADRSAITEVREVVPTWPEMDHQLFWHDVIETRRSAEKAIADTWGLGGFRHLWTYNPQNFERACADITQKTELDDQLMALSLVFHIYQEAGRPGSWPEQLENACNGRPELCSKLEFLSKPQPNEMTRFERRQAELKEKQERQAAEEQEEWGAWKEHLAGNLTSLLGSATLGAITNAQHTLDLHMRSLTTGTGKKSQGDWTSLISEFGEPIAKAFRESATRFWRTAPQKLPSEGGHALVLSATTSLGLTGLAIEAKELPSLFSQMTVAEADVAARFGLLDPYSFPTWLSSLFSYHSDVVARLALQEIESELSAAPSDSRHHCILGKVRRGGAWMFDHIAPSLISRLEKPVTSVTGLQLALSILNDSSIADDSISRLASVMSLPSSEPEIAATWFAAWIGTQPDVAIPALAQHLEAMTFDEDKTRLVMLCLTVIAGNRNGSRCRQQYKAPHHAAELYLLASKHLRVEDDINRLGKGVYSPGLRDDAQDARNGLLNIIRDTPGHEAFLALEKIAREHPVQRLRAWSAFYSEQRATADSKSTPWEPADVVDFQNRLEKIPASHRELWSLAIDRLHDLKHDLENGDSSIAELLLLANQENTLRKHIGNWCRDRAGGRYVMLQEEQLADDKRPDFRLQSSRFDGPVPIELKLADKWPGPRLFERLENQLAGDYLRDTRSSCGIFLVLNQGSRETWETPRGRLTFADLVIALQEEWQSLAPKYPGVSDIKVMGIDLTIRGGKAAAKAIKANQVKAEQSEKE
ncbi:NACHT domain-containing protein [Pseudomonas sp. s4]|uniref:NACHT domain-containing protein n=1 Tax=Pseudomonas TaxID=286 RepID=UPI001F4D9624|nr:hypothetical protein [Pseudomonas plecoglossicida]